jgi:hypothetical protein
VKGCLSVILTSGSIFVNVNDEAVDSLTASQPLTENSTEFFNENPIFERVLLSFRSIFKHQLTMSCSAAVIVLALPLLARVTRAQSNGALIAETTTRFRFTHDFVPDDTFDGQRCVVTGDHQLEYDADSPGQLFQSCYGAAFSATTRNVAGSIQLQFASISGAAISPLGNDAQLSKLYSISPNVPAFTSFASLRIAPSGAPADLQIAAGIVNGAVSFQSLSDAHLQPLLHLSIHDASVNATALAALPLADGPNFFLVRFANSPDDGKLNRTLTGAALRQEVLGNSLALIKFFVAVSPRSTPLVHWEVLGVSRDTLRDSEDFVVNHYTGNLQGNDLAMAVTACVLAVVALFNVLVLWCTVWKLRPRADSDSYTAFVK